MCERFTEKAQQVVLSESCEASQPPTSGSSEILANLRSEFAPAIKRLNFEIEPAIVFRPGESQKDSA